MHTTTKSTPRKVIIGTTLFSVFEDRPYVGLEKRLEEISERMEEMTVDATQKYGRGLDLAVFPENSLNSRVGETPADRAVPLNDANRKALGNIARQHNTYLVVSFNLLEDDGQVFNVATLFDRQGELAGIYRKVFCLADPDGESVERGKTPGSEFPVFETDFGRLAMAICYDMGFDELFESYAASGAEIIVWPSMSPQTVLPRLYARRFGFYLVSSTPRDNASIFDPLGEITSQVTKEGFVTQEIDLEYRLIHWQPALGDGKDLGKKFGPSMGMRYDCQEDYGMVWSNEPDTSVDLLLEKAGLQTDRDARQLARSARKKILEGALPDPASRN